MTKMHVALMIGALTITSGHATAQGEQEPNAAGPSPRRDDMLVVPAPSKRPFSNIFIAPPVQARGPQRPSEPLIVEVPLREAQPRVVCGMTLVPTTPEVDPKMVLQRRPGADVEYKLRALSPPVCKQ